MTSAFETLVHSFNVLKLHISVQFQHNVRLPEYKGSMLHGWFGQALKNHDSNAYQVLYAINGNQSHPKPYIICPSEDRKQDWKKGEILSFEISPDINLREFLNTLNLILIATHLGDTRTLALPVATTIFYENGPEQRAEMGISDTLVRLSIGIEDPIDLVDDLENAFVLCKP